MEIDRMALRNVVALGRVILQQMRQHLSRGQIVDGNDFVALGAEHLAERETTNTAKTIDSNFNRHGKHPPSYSAAGA